MLQATLDQLASEFAIGVIEGDIATDLDAAKLSGRGAQVSLLNTSNGFGGNATSTRQWSTGPYRVWTCRTWTW